jgi:hypothetical protein
MVPSPHFPSCPPAPRPGAAETSRPGGWFSTRAQITVAACACAGASAFIYAFDPSRNAVYPQCFLYRTTGIYCAGCGATRAAYALLHGHVLQALHDNALFVAALPILLYVAASYAAKAWGDNAWPEIYARPSVVTRRGIAIAIILVGFMALRNLPGWPFDWLKPLAA